MPVLRIYILRRNSTLKILNAAAKTAAPEIDVQDVGTELNFQHALGRETWIHATIHYRHAFLADKGLEDFLGF